MSEPVIPDQDGAADRCYSGVYRLESLKRFSRRHFRKQCIEAQRNHGVDLAVCPNISCSTQKRLRAIPFGLPICTGTRWWRLAIRN